MNRGPARSMIDSSRSDSVPVFTDARVVSLIDIVGSDDFFKRLTALLEKNFCFKHFHIFLYRKQSAPVILDSCPKVYDYKRGMRNFVTYTYVINPAYRAFQQATDSGVFLISDLLAPDSKQFIDSAEVDVYIDESEGIGYRTPGWPRNLTECIVLINLPDGTALDMTFLTRSTDNEAYECKRSLNALFPVLNSVLLRQFAVCPGSFDATHLQSDQEDRFQDFGSDILTMREREVLQQILVGLSSNSIALNLAVSLATVKTHRRNIYNKLQISSLAELFSLFLLHLK